MSLSSSLVRNITYPLWLLKEGKGKVLEYAREFKRTQSLSQDQILELQWRKLRKVSEQAYQHSKFYRQRMDSRGLSPSNIKTPKDLRSLPILTKEDIRDRLPEILSDNLPKEELIKTATGGTTGSSFVFYRDLNCHLQRQAIDLVYNLWADWKVGDKTAILWGAPQDLSGYSAFKQNLKNLLIDRIIILDCFNVTPQSMQHFAHQMLSFRPKIIYGYSQAIYLLAQYVSQNLFRKIRVKSAICTAEPLYPSQREFIQNTFECQVFDRYASREFGLIASECPLHEGFHLVADSVYIEILKDGAPAPKGEVGDLVITDLLNYGMPFIRYKIGDTGAWEIKECSCGSNLPLLKNLVGRDTDFLVTPAGGVISGVAIMALLTQYGNRTGIAQMQIIQESIRFIRKSGKRAPVHARRYSAYQDYPAQTFRLSGPPRF